MRYLITAAIVLAAIAVSDRVTYRRLEPAERQRPVWWAAIAAPVVGAGLVAGARLRRGSDIIPHALAAAASTAVYQSLTIVERLGVSPWASLIGLWTAGFIVNAMAWAAALALLWRLRHWRWIWLRSRQKAVGSRQ